MKKLRGILVVAALSACGAVAAPITEVGAIDLSQANTGYLAVNPEAPTGAGTGWVTNSNPQPTGTGVFKPFLTLKAPGYDKVEDAYNYGDGGVTPDYLDRLRDHWNTYLRLGDLQAVTLSVPGSAGQDPVSGQFYVFTLDANEPGGDKRLISIDNIRIYTSANDIVGSVKNTPSNLDTFATLQWAMNDPFFTGNPAEITPWIKLDASLRDTGTQANGGSGIGDMLLYIPTSVFADASPDDYVWFYNLNGVHYEADKDLAATAGFEEWKVLTKTTSVPDGGQTAILLGFGLLSAGFFARRIARATS